MCFCPCFVEYNRVQCDFDSSPAKHLAKIYQFHFEQFQLISSVFSTECHCENEMRPKDAIRCRECGYRIMYKKRTKRCKFRAEVLVIFMHFYLFSRVMIETIENWTKLPNHNAWVWKCLNDRKKRLLTFERKIRLISMNGKFCSIFCWSYHRFVWFSPHPNWLLSNFWLFCIFSDCIRCPMKCPND